MKPHFILWYSFTHYALGTIFSVVTFRRHKPCKLSFTKPLLFSDLFDCMGGHCMAVIMLEYMQGISHADLQRAQTFYDTYITVGVQ